ncbi:hypothetical protein GGI1_07137, partial [Acidithiobacillus sp. GGI-221]
MALDQRRRGILQSLKSPHLGEHALRDAKQLGMIE